jgi:hypothetical protein
MMIFLGVLTVGFVYEWRKGALEIPLGAGAMSGAREKVGVRAISASEREREGNDAGRTVPLVPFEGALAPANDPTFLSINDELADRGFLVTSADELINWARTGSLMWSRRSDARSRDR